MTALFPLAAGSPAVDAVGALLLGAAFGIALERGGLGDPRKLTGQFYGTDFTVPKVMFTAIITCMVGLVVLSGVGLVDLGRMYVTPTWLLPQLVGGLVFGVGFVMGGYCPGTGCVAAASGRQDGFALLGGLLVGSVVFGALFERLRPFNEATRLNARTIPELTGLPLGWLAAAVTTGAIAVFVLLERFERRRITGT